MNYIKLIEGIDHRDAEELVNLFLAGTRDKLVDIKIRKEADKCLITLVMGTFRRYRQKRFEFISCPSEAVGINEALLAWTQQYPYRTLEDAVMLNGGEGMYLKVIFTERDQIR